MTRALLDTLPAAVAIGLFCAVMCVWAVILS